MDIRPLQPGDAPAARALVEGTVSRTPYGALPLLALDRAFEGESDESLAVVAADEGQLAGIALYGLVAGAKGAGKLHFVTVTAAARLQGVAARLLDAAADDLRRRGGRLVIAETPDDPMTRPGLSLLERSGFVLEGRVAGFYRDGVDLLLLRRDL
ncbi:MAG: GNAT family N-acetyltransferase [Gemmatimonadaceae bacterium]